VEIIDILTHTEVHAKNNNHFEVHRFELSVTMHKIHNSIKTKADNKKLDSFPKESKDKDMAAMLVPSFVNVHQHGGDDVTCKRRI
jgi:N-acetylglucosamine-6-phosphate deacetylase